MTSGDQFQSLISTGDNGDASPEGKLGEKPGLSAHRPLLGTSEGDVSVDMTVNMFFGGRDQTQAVILGEYPVTEFPSSIEILSELENIEGLLRDLFDQFDEEDLRQLTLVEIKKKVTPLAESAIHYDNYFSQSITLLEDGLSFIRSESMTKDQVNAMQDVIQILKKVSLERKDARQCGTILREYKIRTLPTID